MSASTTPSRQETRTAARDPTWRADAIPDDKPPVFGFILPGGGITGALVRDVRLANELADRGYRVVVWWAYERVHASGLRPQIRQHWLFHTARCVAPLPRGLSDAFGQWLNRFTHDGNRERFLQVRPRLLEHVMRRLIDHACEVEDRDRRLVRRFARQVAAEQITHFLPTLEILCPYVAAIKDRVPQSLRYVVTFQGYELYANYARPARDEGRLYECLRKAVARSDWRPIVVSEPYGRRVASEVGVSPDWMSAIPPGVPVRRPIPRGEAMARVLAEFPTLKPEVPLVTYLGRRSAEKGIDLLLYAAQLLRRQGHEMQLVVCGPASFGNQYSTACKQIADNLRCHVRWRDVVSDDLRDALFAASRCVVYPSIHGEPFGMVPVEALAQGTPAVVPDYGGVATAIAAEGRTGGLNFRAWDSGDLAEQIRRLLVDEELWERLSAAGPDVAEHYSVERMADRVLVHLGLPRRPDATLPQLDAARFVPPPASTRPAAETEAGPHRPVPFPCSAP